MPDLLKKAHLLSYGHSLTFSYLIFGVFEVFGVHIPSLDLLDYVVLALALVSDHVDLPE